MASYYEILGVAPTASADEIRRAFRREIARYHPDKVQHLGKEFEAIASSKAAELMLAHRTLSDELARADYNGQLKAGPAPPSERASPAPSSQREDTPARPWTPGGNRR